MLADDKLDDEDIECDGVGDIVFEDAEDRKFFAAFRTADLTVQLGDVVRVKLESNEPAEASDGPNEKKQKIKPSDDEALPEFSFAQVLCIFEDSHEEVFVEVRWFLQEYELTDKQLKM